jgi:tRNA-specific 2-thiouridylase
MLKFSLVWDLLEETFGITRLATGHYARVIDEDGAIRLRMAKDKDKDQSYFLYGIPGRRLADLVLPLGQMTKRQVRAIASALGLSVAQKAESMELCFAGEGDYRPALGDGDMNLPGDMTDMQGRKIGEHKGIANYTLGQRRGLGVAGGQPLYVGRIDARTNTVALGTKEQVSSRIVCAAELNILLLQWADLRPAHPDARCSGRSAPIRPTLIARVGMGITVE